MIFSENRYTLFRIMLLAKARYAAGGHRTSSCEIARRKIADVELTASPILPKFIAA
jgi:hypothetical protein